MQTIHAKEAAIAALSAMNCVSVIRQIVAQQKTATTWTVVAVDPA